MKTVIYNGKIILQDQIIENHNLYYENGKIVAISEKKYDCDNSIDARGNYVSPGFIDIHTHGAGGADFLDNSVEAYITAATVHARYGATAIVPTLTSIDIDGMKGTIDVFKKVRDTEANCAQMLGLHAEGPYFAQSQKGAQEPRFIHDFDEDEYNEILKIGGDCLLRWSAAPELPGFEEFADAVTKYDILPCIGHSDAEFECVEKAKNAGFTHVTHLYSGTSTVHRRNAFRYAGIVEAAYYFDDMTVEIIADGIHLPPSLLKLIYKLKGPDKIALITDSMRGAGMPEGESVLGNLNNGLPVIIEDGVAKLMDRSAFAGSVATCDRLVRNMVNLADVPLADAVTMASLTPAKILNIDNKGALKPGYDADIIIFDENIDVKNTIVNGRVIF
ncbi:MAG: N-acetylglucosamine-6-phosphate deacetylase [Clostridia bacterium]|nr:N-acetylglucosamine-6-phosphate deacetylase [Clostridia bacterium]